MPPLVSILIPAYNAEQWVAETIASAVGQTWQTKKVIVVDDGSSDQTLSVARQFASKSVQVVTQANQGASATRNRAYSLCQGDDVQWLDTDDFLAPDEVERQINKLDKCPSRTTLLSGAWGAFNYRLRKARFSPTALWCDLTPLDWLLRKMGQNLHMQTDNWLVSRELSDAAGPWDRRLSHDDADEYFSRVIMASDRIKFVPEARSYYRAAGFNSVSYIGGSSKKL